MGALHNLNVDYTLYILYITLHYITLHCTEYINNILGDRFLGECSFLMSRLVKKSESENKGMLCTAHCAVHSAVYTIHNV